MFIYFIKNKISNDVLYVGSCGDFKKRMIEHLSDCFNQNCPRYNFPIYLKIREIGKKAIKFTYREYKLHNNDELKAIEQFYICKCHPAMNKRQAQILPESQSISMKQCKTCRQVMDINRFPNGRRECKICRSEINKKIYQEIKKSKS